MKILLLLLFGLFFSPCVSVNAEIVHKVEGNKIIAVSTKSSSSKVEETPYIYVDTKGKEYRVYKTAKGRYFVNKVSAKGKEYKYYLPKDIKL